MQTFNIEQLRAFSPCYDPAKYLPENWAGTAIDILNVKDCPPQDRLWVVLRKEFLSDRDLRLFAVWCARKALAIPGCENEVCSNTCDVAERYANGEATKEELAAAWYAARAAAWYAARYAAWDAAWAAAWYAARAAARAAAWAAARDAAMDAARDAAMDAAMDAAWAAARDAAMDAAMDAAWAAARDAAMDAQIEHLKTFTFL